MPQDALEFQEEVFRLYSLVFVKATDNKRLEARVLLKSRGDQLAALAESAAFAKGVVEAQALDAVVLYQEGVKQNSRVAAARLLCAAATAIVDNSFQGKSSGNPEFTQL
ncbi:hypothetical protein MRX96_049078 [Rhipicephalus microplus]